LFAAFSVNHSAPSGPATMCRRSPAGDGTGNGCTVTARPTAGSASSSATAASASGTHSRPGYPRCALLTPFSFVHVCRRCATLSGYSLVTTYHSTINHRASSRTYLDSSINARSFVVVFQLRMVRYL